MVLPTRYYRGPSLQPLDHLKSETLLGDLKRLAEARNADSADKSARDRKNMALKQYTKSLIPILIKIMVDAASADKAEAEAPAPKEHGTSPASTPATTSVKKQHRQRRLTAETTE